MTDRGGQRGAAGPAVDRWALRRPDGTVVTGWALMPLRLFLGVTFTYAGLQKLANPDFFRSSSAISIHAQLVGAERSSPIHALLGGLVHAAPVVGALIALGEVAIGLGTLVGLWARVAAGAGMLLSFGLFLTVSFHSSPYFTGSDIVFLFAWTPLVLAGAAAAPALDTWFADRRSAPAVSAGGPDGVSRREVVSKGAVTGLLAGVVVVLGGVVAGVGRAVAPSTTSASGTALGGGSAPTPTTTPTTAAPTGSTATTGAAPAGHKLGPASDVPVGGSATFTDPASGDPGLVIQSTAGSYVAFDAVCPHAGCTVAYAKAAQIIACPCHGSEFDPRTGAVVQGPASRGLTAIRVALGSDGDLYVDG
jgi:thiosulfate dehydrogenase [quinone] large subunit